MPKLSFQQVFKHAECADLDLPVEVRKLNLALVARTLSSQPIDVQPGKYVVIANMPAGQQLTSQVVVSNKDEVASLMFDSADESPQEVFEQQHFVGVQDVPPPQYAATLSARSDARLPTVPSADEVRLAVFSQPELLTSDVEKATAVAAKMPDFRQWGSVMQFYVRSGGPVAFLRVVYPGGNPIAIALPIGNSSQCRVVLRWLPDGTCVPDIHLENGQADLLLRGLQRGYLEETALAAQSKRILGEELLQAKIQDPIAAAVGAYVLLQFNDLERLHEWTQNLMNWFEWLPDGAIVRGEHEARRGRHKEALTAFLRVRSGKPPLFSDGLSYLLQRLKLYTGPVATKEFDKSLTAAAFELLNSFQSVTSYVDYSKPILTLLLPKIVATPTAVAIA